jgi:predicted deacylase
MIERSGCLIATLVATLALAAATGAQERGSFAVGPVRAVAGAAASGFIEVPAGVDAATRIPVTVMHWAKPGPVLALVAGTHGYEYPPILALQRLRRELDPLRLSGTVILVHVANLPSFLGRTIYYSPVDGKNLNRVYPGRADGTQSERIAHEITTEVIDRADYLADLHCGDGNEALRPYSYWMVSGNERVDAASKGMVLAFGLDHVVIDTERPSDPRTSVYTATTAALRGKPAITTESGMLGASDEASVELALRGCWNLLRHLDMVEGDPVPPPAVVWLDRYESCAAGHRDVRPAVAGLRGRCLLSASVGEPSAVRAVCRLVNCVSPPPSSASRWRWSGMARP